MNSNSTYKITVLTSLILFSSLCFAAEDSVLSKSSFNAAQRKLIETSPTRGQKFKTAADLAEERIDWLETQAEFDDQDAKKELKRVAPARYKKIFGDE